MSPQRILVAEDDGEMLALIVGWLREAGYDVTACGSGSELLDRLEQSVLSDEIPGFDLVLSDIQMPWGSAFDVMNELFRCEGVPPMVLITAFGDRWTHAAARHLGAAAVLEKPFDKGRLLAELLRLGGQGAVAGAAPTPDLSPA